MKALFIGRFQPFHKGHLEAIKHISDTYSEILIGIGSSQYSNTVDNPFSSDERALMIKDTLKKEKIRNYKIVLIPDIHNPPKWVDHVLSIIDNFDVVVSNSLLTKKLFEEKGFKTEETPIFNKENYSGKEIRRRIYENEPWEHLLPKSCVEIIKKTDGVKRIKDLNS